MASVLELPNVRRLRSAGRNVTAPVVGIALLGAVLLFDLVDSERSLSTEGPPLGSGLYVLRSGLLLAASTALMWGARAHLRRLPRRQAEPAFAAIVAAAGGGTVIALTSVVLLLRDPSELSRLVREDHVVEWASAGLAFLAGVLFLLAAGRRGGDSTRGTVMLGMLGAACIFLGLEEISWFQRVLDIQSPEIMLNRNGQKETNLHNLATGATGNVYYIGACLYGVIIPALLGDRRLPVRLQWLQPAVPSRLVLFGSATAAALVYEMWNIAWIQMTFWLTLVALWMAGRSPRLKLVAVWVAAVMVVTTAAFLIRGETMVRGWDDTEIRELVIPFALALAGLEALTRHAPKSDQ